MFNPIHKLTKSAFINFQYKPLVATSPGEVVEVNTLSSGMYVKCYYPDEEVKEKWFMVCDSGTNFQALAFTALQCDVNAVKVYKDTGNYTYVQGSTTGDKLPLGAI